MHRNSFSNGPHSVTVGAARSSARDNNSHDADIMATEDDPDDDDTGESNALAASSPNAVHSEPDEPLPNSVVFAHNDQPRSSNPRTAARTLRRAHSVSLAHTALGSPSASQRSPPPPYKNPLAIATDETTQSPGNAAGYPQTTAATANSPTQDSDQPRGLTFLPFDHLDPDYQPAQDRFHASEAPPSASTRNPFSYLAKRLGGGFKGHKPSWAGPSLTIADGVMANGRAHPYLSPATHEENDAPLRRFSTTAVNVPKMAARSTAPERADSNYRPGSKPVTANRQGSWLERIGPHHHRRQQTSTAELHQDPSLQPYEIAIEDMGLFHDPLFGLPTIDAHPMAAEHLRGIRRSSTSSTSSSSDGASVTSEADHPCSPAGASLPPVGMMESGGNHLRRRMTQSSGSSVSPHLKFPAQPRARRSLDTLHRRMEAFQRHNHPLPAAINPLGRPTRMAEALYMRSDWKRQLFLFTEDPSSGTWAFIFNVAVCALIFVSVVVSVIETLPSVFFWNPDFWFYIETVFVALFTLEYIVRLLAHSDSLRQFLRHVFSFLSIVDLAAIVPYYVQIGLGRDVSNELHFTGIRVIRLFRLFNVFKYISSLQLSIEILIIAIQRSLEALIVLTFFMIMSVMIFSTFLYFIERGTYDEVTQGYINSKGEPSKFDSIPAALWFSLAALTTTGFGDVTPATSGGKVMAFPLIMSGILLISIPSIIVGREFTVVRQALRLRRRREVQLIQQRQRDAKKREKRRHRKLLGGLLHPKETQSSPGLSRADTSHTITERAPDIPRLSNKHQLHPAPTKPLDAQVIDVIPSTDEELTSGTSNSSSHPPSKRTSPGPLQSKPTSKFHPRLHFRKGPIDWQSGGQGKQVRSKRGKQRSSDPALDLTRTSTEDLRRYSFDEDFVVMSQGYRGVQLKGAKNKQRHRQSGDGSAKPGHSGAKLRSRMMATTSTNHHAEEEEDSNDSMLDLDDGSSGLSTDAEPLPSDDSMEADADDHDCCVNDATRKSLERLPTMLGDMAKALQGVQESQRALERNLVLITQRIDAMETQTHHQPLRSDDPAEDNHQTTASSTTDLARSLSGRENRSATYLASPMADHHGCSRAIAASAHTTPHSRPRRSFTNPPATLLELPPPHHAETDAMARHNGGQRPAPRSSGASTPVGHSPTGAPQNDGHAPAVLRTRTSGNRLAAEDRRSPSH
ncbi:hypothetical protein H4R35_003732 [Dimargaris xerosporica]|nr:hypothetical protein H4R35_003732 [Dimargaris xerosporica]